MTAEQLKNSILQEAISGRLVPQDPNDEPASVLLERMQNDKRKVIPIQDEEMPYEIPSSWEWVNLGSIVSIITGKKDANFGSEDGTYDFFTCSNTPIKCKSYSYDGDYLIMPGNGANIGKVIHYKGKFEAYQRTYLLQGYGNFDLDYLKYHLMCNWKEYNQDKLYGSAIPYIKLGNLMSYPVALPPLAEQKRIVAKLEELLPIVEQYGKAQMELDELNTALPARLRQSILQEAISGRLVPQDPNDGKVDTLLDDVSRIKQQMLIRKEIKKGSLVSIPIEDEEIEYSIPDSWRFVRLQDICTCIFSGKSPKYSQIPTKHKIIGQQSNQWTGVEMRYVKYGTDEYAKDIPQIQYLQDHDVLLNTLGNGTLGRSGIYYSSYSNTPVLTDGHIFVLRTPHEVTAKYILAYLRVKFVDINRSADGSTNQTFLNLTKTSKWIIPLPPLAEQQRIVAKIEELFAEIDKLK